MADYGECIIRGLDHDGQRYQRIEIVKADPRILIADEWLTEIRKGGGEPHMQLDGNVLTIVGSNRTVVYRIMGHEPDWFTRAWIAEWPD
jgi:hypothetical protein